VATNLLLEGDDLEALLARARAEGGPHARIVRAEKLRHGGVLGFFAKEKFEVALEIPDEFRTSAQQEEPMSQPAPAPVVAPQVAAQEGLLGLARRADAAELAAARPEQPAVPDALDLALRRLLEPEPASVLAGTGASQWGAQTVHSTVHPSTSRPEFTALLDQLLEPARPGEALAAAVPAPRPSEPAPAVWPSSEPPSEPSPAPTFTPPAPAAPTPSSFTSSAVPSSMSPSMSPSMSSAVSPSMSSAVSRSASPSVPPAYREVSLPPAAPAYPQPVPVQQETARPPVQRVERHTLGRTTRAGEGVPNRDRREDPQLAADRNALRALGVPTAWTRQLRPGDRFTAVLRMLDRMPEVDIDPATPIVAVVGPASSVLLEAHRTALDLPAETADGPVPRPVVLVPAAAGAERAAALAEARLIGDVVVAIEADGTPGVAGAERAVEALQIVGAGAVIAIVGADGGLERAQAFLDALGQVDALAVEGTGASTEPAAVLQLGLPVVRLDGIPIDRYTWTAVLLAQLGPVPGR
jgi:hypothetical protein